MDYTRLPRKLIYRDRKELEEFGVQNAESLEGRIFSEILQMDIVNPERKDSEEKLLEIFNDAYYILTMVLLEKLPYLRMEQYLKIARTWADGKEDFKKATVVLSLVNLLIIDTCITNSQLQRFRYRLADIVKRYEEEKYVVKTRRLGLFLAKDNSHYSPRTITRECLEGIEWEKLTDDYDPESIRALVNHLGKSDYEKKLIVDAINKRLDNSVKKYSLAESVTDLLRKLQVQWSSTDHNSIESMETYISDQSETEERTIEAVTPQIVLADGHKVDFVRTVQAMVDLGYFKRTDGKDVTATEVGRLLLRTLGVNNTWKSLLQTAFKSDNPLSTIDELRDSLQQYWQNRAGITDEIRKKGKRQ